MSTAFESPTSKHVAPEAGPRPGDIPLFPLPLAPNFDAGRVARQFAALRAGLPGAEEVQATLFAPLWSPAHALIAFEARLVALYRAHLTLADAARERPTSTPPEYQRLHDIIHAYNMDWPVLSDEHERARQPADRTALLYGRPDVVLTAEGPRVVETNFDTAIGGYDRTDDIWTASVSAFEVEPALQATGRPLSALRAYFEDFAAGQRRRIHWIMKDDAAVRARLDRMLAQLVEAGTPVEHLIHYAGSVPAGAPDDVPAFIHRACAITTVNQARPAFAHTLAALAARTRGCTVPVALSHLESKLFLAWLSDPQARPASLTPDETEAIASLVPWTRVLTLLGPEELRDVRGARADFILKKADSYQARDVFFGCNLEAAAWEALLEEKRREPGLLAGLPNIWIVQRRAHPRPQHLIEIAPEGLRERVSGLSCCPYLLGGRLRALETWVTPFTPDLDMIHHMQFVAHFIRPDRP